MYHVLPPTAFIPKYFKQRVVMKVLVGEIPKCNLRRIDEPGSKQFFPLPEARRGTLADNKAIFSFLVINWNHISQLALPILGS